MDNDVINLNQMNKSEVIERLEQGLEDVLDEDMDSAAWGMQYGVLLSGNEAKKILELLQPTQSDTKSAEEYLEENGLPKILPRLIEGKKVDLSKLLTVFVSSLMPTERQIDDNFPILHHDTAYSDVVNRQKRKGAKWLRNIIFE